MPSVTFFTCMHRPERYAACRESVGCLRRPAGWEVALDMVDNVANTLSCPTALNQGWDAARTDYVVFCHDDVTFPEEWLEFLERTLERIGSYVPPWAVLGSMGRHQKRFLGHSVGPKGEDFCSGDLPALVETLDEFCLVVRRELPFRFDERLGGYHLYGVDLCLQVTEAGYGCFAADLPCRHYSDTRHRPPAYHVIKRRLQRKWRFGRRRVGRTVGTTCGRIRFGWFEGWI